MKDFFLQPTYSFTGVLLFIAATIAGAHFNTSWVYMTPVYFLVIVIDAAISYFSQVKK